MKGRKTQLPSTFEIPWSIFCGSLFGLRPTSGRIRSPEATEPLDGCGAGHLHLLSTFARQLSQLCELAAEHGAERGREMLTMQPSPAASDEERPKGGLDSAEDHDARAYSLTRHWALASDGRRELFPVLTFIFHAIAVSSNDERLPVMHQPIDHGGRQCVVHVEDLAPVTEDAIGR